MQRLLKEGEDDFSPDFLIWKPVEGTPGAFWLFNVEVKYRSDQDDFFRFGGAKQVGGRVTWESRRPSPRYWTPSPCSAGAQTIDQPL